MAETAKRRPVSGAAGGRHAVLDQEHAVVETAGALDGGAHADVGAYPRHDERADAAENERIEIVEAPIAELDRVIRECRDAKSLAGLLWFRAYLA